MKKVCLKVGLSYNAKGFSCVKGSPVYVEDDVAAKLEKIGRFDVADVESVKPADSGSADAAVESVDITSMKKDELVAFAKEHGIDIGGCKNNEERIQRIQEEIDSKGFAQVFPEE